MAAPTVTRTPNVHRAKTAHRECEWKHGDSGHSAGKQFVYDKHERNHLTPTGLLMEGDFNPMNNGMRYGLVWALAPRHYNDSVDEVLTRPLARYVRELIRIRKQYANLLFFGRFNDNLGAAVHGDADIRYSVFKSSQPDKQARACVVVNYGDASESVMPLYQFASPFRRVNWR